MRPTTALCLAGGWSAVSLLAGLAQARPAAPAAPPAPPALAASAPAAAPSGALAPADAASFAERFTREVWPLLDRAAGGCVACHGPKNPSQLHFPSDGPRASFFRLLAHGYFEPENPSSLLARVTSSVPERRMPPPPAPAWSETEIDRLRRFVMDLDRRLQRRGTPADELFPRELLEPYRGPRRQTSLDNTFLTYRQLRGKILALFGDAWVRGGRDLFQENIAQFGGADFVHRFDESARPSASFLSALDALSRDVASRAYLQRTGPFAGRPERLPSLLAARGAAAEAPPAYRAEIRRLYRKLLFRDPTEAEVRQAFQLVRGVYQSRERLRRQESLLDFELEVRDSAGRSTTRAIRLRLTSEPLGLYQEYVNQSAPSETPQVRHRLERTFVLRPGDPEQRLLLGNEGTHGNVSFAAVEIEGPLPEKRVRRIAAGDPSIRLQGAWRRVSRGGFDSFEDDGNDKGNSRIEVPLAVERPGRYAVWLVWRRAETEAGPARGRRGAPLENSRAVPVEVYSHDPPKLANPPVLPVPPKGEAHFWIDQTWDTIPHWDLEAAFRFGPEDGVEIRNEGTRRRVVADAVRFEPLGGGSALLLDDDQAEGGWPPFIFPSFRPFNLVGKGALSDNNERKGELRLLYRPARSPEWNAERFYRPLIVFPGQADNETRVPVVVRARESTPILQVSAPSHAQIGAVVTLDATASYNLQRTPLTFTWRQVGGPRVRLADPHAPRITFTAAPMEPEQAAWEALCRALMKHPDFLFTRPPSLALPPPPRGTGPSPADRRRLQLVKIAQDLVARPPTEAELRRLEAGASLRSFVDGYLESQEFRDFYFHRVRLTLESRGSAEEDEPARLWAYVAFEDRPFREILTADYTVDEAFRRQSRPAYHGRTGLLTMKGFIKGKPGLPHFNYAAMVTEKFLGYVYEVPPSIVMMREGITAVSTTSPTSACYSCHKILTPLAYQRLAWDDDGNYRPTENGRPVDDTDRGLVPSYPYRGKGMEAFALNAVRKERFVRTILQTHFVWYFGREMRYEEDERGLYRRLWDAAVRSDYRIRDVLRALMTSPEYLNGGLPAPDPAGRKAPARGPSSRRVSGASPGRRAPR